MAHVAELISLAIVGQALEGRYCRKAFLRDVGEISRANQITHVRELNENEHNIIAVSFFSEFQWNLNNIRTHICEIAQKWKIVALRDRYGWNTGKKRRLFRIADLSLYLEIVKARRTCVYLYMCVFIVYVLLFLQAVRT